MRRGFTIIELIVVIVIIGILAAVTLVTYNGAQERSEFAKATNDLQHINDALKVYQSQNGSYPTTSGLWQDASSSAALDSLVPDSIDSLPTASNKTGYSYQYRSDGTNYKLLRVIAGGLPSIEANDNENLNTTGTYAGTAESRISWGYWSDATATSSW